MPTPRRYSNGITNVASGAVFDQLGMPDPTKYHVFMDDFHREDFETWSMLFSGSSTVALQDSDDGRILITLPATDNTYMVLQAWTGAGGETFTLEAGKKLWFKAKFQGNDVDQTDIAAGLISRATADTGVFGVGAADGVTFATDDGDANLDFNVRSGSASISANAAVDTLTDATDKVVGFYFDGVQTITYYTGENNLNGTVENTSFPTAELIPVIGIRNGEATANTLNIDYICVIKER
ncbi:MAG: hypothetical protein GY861_02820 [bacterium]|nr:hypothetical protein [bacterium]